MVKLIIKCCLIWNGLREQFRRRLRRWMYDHLYNGSAISIGGFRYKLHTQDSMCRGFFVKRGYRENFVDILRCAAPNFNSFVDCGAHIGTISIPLVSSIRLPTLAVEPVTSNSRVLNYNISINGLSSVVHTLQVAISDRPGKLLIYLSNNNSGDHRLSETEIKGRLTEEVSVVTLDSCIQSDPRLIPPILVKIDVQGYDYKVLSGAPKLLSIPSLIVFEFWPMGLAAANSSVSQFAELIKANQLTAFELLKGKYPRLGRLNDISALVKRTNVKPDFHCDVFITNMDIEKTGLAGFVADES